MKRKVLSLLLAVLMVCALMGCGETVSGIAGSVADAAKAELEAQVKATLEKYKMDVIEVKTTAGNLCGEGNAQFFCAALVKSESDAIPQSCADALGKVFEKSGLVVQTTSQITSEYLEHKSLSFNHSDFSDGTYYAVYVYSSNVTGK